MADSRNTQSNSQPRTAVVTGASSGIGLVAAKTLAAQGWRVIGLGRDPQRLQRAEASLRATAAPGVRIDMLRADLSLLSEAARAAREIIALTDRIDVLFNNAGGTSSEQVITAEGFEATFTSNHLGPFVLTNHLLPLLRATARTAAPGAVRIINTSSSAHLHVAGLDWDDLQGIENFTTGTSYMRVKLANILFTHALERRVADDGIVTHAVHPGMVDSNFASRGDAGMQQYFKDNHSKTVTPEAGADTLIWLATADEPGKRSGGYYYQRALTPMSEAAQDQAAAERLWQESERLATSKGV